MGSSVKLLGLTLLDTTHTGPNLTLHFETYDRRSPIRYTGTLELLEVTAVRESWEGRGVEDGGRILTRDPDPLTWKPSGTVTRLRIASETVDLELTHYGPGDTWPTTYTIQCSGARIERHLLNNPLADVGRWLFTRWWVWLAIVVWLLFHLAAALGHPIHVGP